MYTATKFFHVQKRGFTLLEVVIAVTISVAVVGIAIPSFVSLVRRQEFQSEASRLAGCLQEAQEYVLTSRTLASGEPIRWAAAELSYNQFDQNTTCRVLLFAATPWASLTLASPAAEQASSKVYASLRASGFSYVGNNGIISDAESVRIYFGQSERGAVMKFLTSSYTLPASYSQYGTPFFLSLISPVDSDQAVAIRIEATGTPIQLTSE